MVKSIDIVHIPKTIQRVSPQCERENDLLNVLPKLGGKEDGSEQ